MNQHAIIVALSGTIVELNAQGEMLREALNEQASVIDTGFIRFSEQEETISSLRASRDHANRVADEGYAESGGWRSGSGLWSSRHAGSPCPGPDPPAEGDRLHGHHGKDLSLPTRARSIAGTRFGCIKAVREKTGCGLKEAKDLVEAWHAEHPLECQDDEPKRPTLVSALRP